MAYGTLIDFFASEEARKKSGLQSGLTWTNFRLAMIAHFPVKISTRLAIDYVKFALILLRTHFEPL